MSAITLTCDRCGATVCRLRVCEHPTPAEAKRKRRHRVWICDECKRKEGKR